MIQFITDHPIYSLLTLAGFCLLAILIFIKVLDWQEARDIKKRQENDKLSLSDHDWRGSTWDDKNRRFIKN